MSIDCTTDKTKYSENCIKNNCDKGNLFVVKAETLGPIYWDTQCVKKTNEEAFDGFLILFILGLIICVILLFGIFSINSFKVTDPDSSVASSMGKGFISGFIYVFVENADYTMLFIIYTMLVTALITIMYQAYYLKSEYEYGENLEKQCDGVFIEKERGDYHISQTYMNIISCDDEDDMKIQEGFVQKNLKHSYNNLISIVGIVLIFAIIYNFAFIKIYYEMAKNYYIIGSLIAILFIQIGLLTLWFYKSNDILNPFTSSIENVKKSYGRINMTNLSNSHITYILLISTTVITVLLAPYLYEDKANNLKILKKVSKNTFFPLIFLFIVLCILFRFFIKSGHDLETSIENEYLKSIDELNKYILQNYENDKNLKKELEKNIILDKSVNNNIPTNIDLKEYKCTLYAYLPHILEKTIVRIPQEIKELIQPIYLAGEESLKFRDELIKLYNNYDGVSITSKQLKDDNNSLLTYFKKDILKKIEEEDSTDIVNLLNTYVILNNEFKIVNPLPETIIEKLKELREKQNIKKAINSYQSGISIITYIVFFIVFYSVFHYLYITFKDLSIQIVSAIAVMILIIIGFIGWWAKEFWL
jgi:hypothetical protein